MNQETIFDVIVVGAGISGLSAARVLKQRNKSVLVVQSRDRVGGRTYTHKFPDGTAVDMGATWLSKQNTRMLQLCKELKIELLSQYQEGDAVLLHNQKDYFPNPKFTINKLVPILLLIYLLRRPDFILYLIFSLICFIFTVSLPQKPSQQIATRFPLIGDVPIPAEATERLNQLYEQVEKLSQKVNLDEPWLTEDANYLDSITFADFAFQFIKSPLEYHCLCEDAECIYSVSLKKISLLYSLWFNKANGGFESLTSDEGGTQEYKLQGGAFQVCQKFGKELEANIVLSSPVKEIDDSKGEKGPVRVITEQGVYLAQKVFVSVPPIPCSRIKFTQPLPIQRLRYTKEVEPGNCVKVWMVYDQPWWRKNNFCFGKVADGNEYAMSVYEESPSDASRGILLVFVLGDRVQKFMQLEENERKQNMINVIVQLFGQEGQKIQYYKDYTFTGDQWTEGCFMAMFPPQLLTDIKFDWRKPFGNITWIGSEAAVIGHGHLEGAVRTGEAAAQAI